MRFGKVFWEFLWLGCISFGGPAAHVGYFHRRFVVRLGWLDAGPGRNCVRASRRA
ncbi:MAG: chromate transporter [Alcanivorax sp.]|nr:chromate transporter [Alcanivorax sp.]